MRTVGIVGGLGYMGGEALRVLLDHPEFQVEWVTSRSGLSIGSVHRNLPGVDIPVITPESITPCDAYLLAVPSGEAMTRARDLLETGGRVIDLGADFRLKSRTDWERVYGKSHVDWDLAETAVYGLAELRREEIVSASLVANPGCFSSAVILATAPLLSEALVGNDALYVTGLSGTAGIGAEPSVVSHHPEIGNSVVPYNVVDHRHTYEMEQELSAVRDAQVTVHFTPCYIPITRGIVAVCSLVPTRAIAVEALRTLYRDFYSDEFFIVVMNEPYEQDVSWQWRPYPSVSAVSGTNFCHIGLDYDEARNRIVIFSVLDSMGKGGAHTAVQNLNIMFGLDETLGLSRRGMHPY
jgi:N-acetyl-gamma-glutamyl-phosphate reductase common form